MSKNQAPFSRAQMKSFYDAAKVRINAVTGSVRIVCLATVRAERALDRESSRDRVLRASVDSG